MTTRARLKTAGFVLFNLSLAACSSGGGGGVTNNPPPPPPPAALTVVSSTPANAASDFSRRSNIVVTFSAPLNPATVSASAIALSTAAGSQDIQLAVAGAELRIIPNARLLPATSYTLTIPSSLRGTQGEVLASNVALNFTTAARSWQTAAPIPGVSGAKVVGFDSTRAPNGDLLAVWTYEEYTPAAPPSNMAQISHRHLFARYSEADGWSDPVQFGADAWSDVPPEVTESFNRPRVAAGANGDIFVALNDASERSVLTYRYVSADDRWEELGAALDGADEAGEAAIAVDADGNALVAAAIYDTDLLPPDTLFAMAAYFSASDPAAGWSEAEILDSDSQSPERPQVAFDGSGNGLVVWSHFDFLDDSQNNVWTARYEPANGWLPAQAVAVTSTDDAYPQVEMNDAGEAVILFAQGPRPDPAESLRMWSVRNSDAASWTAAPIAGSTATSERPSMDLNAALDGFAVWEQDTGHTAVQVARHSAAGWVVGSTLDDPNAGDASSPEITVDANGNAAATWCQESGGVYNVWAARFEEATQWQPAQRLEQNTTAVECLSFIALDGNGDTTAAWVLIDASDQASLMFNRYE